MPKRFSPILIRSESLVSGDAQLALDTEGEVPIDLNSKMLGQRYSRGGAEMRVP